MHKFFTSCFTLLFILSLSLSIFAADLPPAADCAKITILTPNGWSLRILKDGSAELSYGRMVRDTTHAKKGSFDYNDVFEKITAVLNKTGDVLSTFTVSIEKNDESALSELYTADFDLINQFFETAKENVSFNTFFKTAWKNNPPGLPK